MFHITLSHKQIASRYIVLEANCEFVLHCLRGILLLMLLCLMSKLFHVTLSQGILLLMLLCLMSKLFHTTLSQGHIASHVALSHEQIVSRYMVSVAYCFSCYFVS